MAVATCVVWCLMVSQPAPETRPAPPAREEAAAPLVPVETPRVRLTPETIVAQGMTPLDRKPLPGRPIALHEALSRTVGRARQLEMIRSYWHTAVAVAEYRFRRDEFEQIQALAARAAAEQASAASQQANRLLLEQASASARLREAELRAIAAQTELGERLLLPPGEPLPLAADAPLTGEYRTYLEQLFAGRVTPPRLLLIDRLLPLRQELIVARAEAVQAASDALQGVKDQYQRRELEGDVVAPAVVDLGTRRATFLAAVADYNFDIAEYALAIAPEVASPAALVPMLIKTKPADAATTSPQQPTEVSPPEKPTPQDTPMPTTTPMPPAGAPVDQPKAGSGDQAKADRGELRSVLIKPGEATASRPTTRLRLAMEYDAQQFDPDATQADSINHEVYAALLPLPAPQRTHRLAKLMHWDRSLQAPVGKETSLSDCLALASPAQRSQVLTAYWKARETAARCQTHADRADHLAILTPLVLAAHDAAGGAEAMLSLRSQQFDAQADLLQARARLLASQFELSALVGRSARLEDYLRPITPPHGGRYDLHTDIQPRTIAEANKIARLTDRIPALHGVMEQRSEAVVRADVERDALVNAFQQGKLPLEEVLRGVARQTAESLAFLETLSRYNTAIAEYVLAVTPAAPAPQLAASLVVQP